MLDRVAFDMSADDLGLNGYSCDICGTVYTGENSEDKARECCQEYCEECGDALPDGENGLCDDCQNEESEEE